MTTRVMMQVVCGSAIFYGLFKNLDKLCINIRRKEAVEKVSLLGALMLQLLTSCGIPKYG